MEAEIPYCFIAIEGNIGAGKTRLAEALAAATEADLLLEEFDQNPHIRAFYQGQSEAIYPLEWTLRQARYELIETYFSQARHLRKLLLISDFHPLKSNVFAPINLDEEARLEFETHDPFLNYPLPGPDLLLFLEVPVDQLQKNILARGRTYEKQIPSAYLQEIQKGYLHEIRRLEVKTLIIRPDWPSPEASSLAATLVSLLTGKEFPTPYTFQFRWA